jgi:hypothetical protein
LCAHLIGIVRGHCPADDTLARLTARRSEGAADIDKQFAAPAKSVTNDPTPKKS